MEWPGCCSPGSAGLRSPSRYPVALLLNAACCNRCCPLPAQPLIVFVGEKFESVPALQLAKSLLLDMFRGEQVDRINLAGIDRVVMAGGSLVDGWRLCRRVGLGHGFGYG